MALGLHDTVYRHHTLRWQQKSLFHASSCIPPPSSLKLALPWTPIFLRPNKFYSLTKISVLCKNINIVYSVDLFTRAILRNAQLGSVRKIILDFTKKKKIRGVTIFFSHHLFSNTFIHSPFLCLKLHYNTLSLIFVLFRYNFVQ